METKLMAMNESRRDDTFNRAMKFVDNMKIKHPGVSNIYVFTTTDKDGNIVDEKYGMNLMTNYGFRTLFQGTTKFDGSVGKLYVGEGTGAISITSATLESACFGGLAATNTNTNKAYGYPIYYAAADEDGDGLITLISRFLICEYPENITNFADPARISEYGIGTSATALWTHSHVYSDDGNLSNILKNPEEKLTITIYMCLSFYERLIQEGWSDNRFMVITNNSIMYHRMFEEYLYTYKRNNIIYQRGSCGNPWQSTIDQYHTISTTDDNSFTNSTIMAPFTMYDGAGNESGYFDGFIYKCDGMLIIEPQFLDEAEDVSIENYYSLDATSSSGFSDKFGTYPSSSNDYSKTKYPPMTHFTNAHAFLYDWKTKSWDNELSIYNPDSKWYSETPSQTSCAIPIYYSNKGEILTGYLYQNLRPDDKILAVRGGGVTVYATDKYWANSNTEPWIWIQDFENIPPEAQKAKYWITNNNTDPLKFVRASDTFQLLEKGGTTPADNGYELYNEFAQQYGCFSWCDNYDYGWYMCNNIVYIPGRRVSYTLGVSGAQATESMTYGKFLITFNSVNNSIFVTDMEGVADGGSFSPNTVTTTFTGNVNSLTGCYRTQSETGLICMQSVTSGVVECNIIDIRSDTFKQVKKAWKMSCCIWGTNKIAYIPAGDDVSSIHIYNMETESDDGDPIPFPEGVTSIPFMFGHTNYVWFTNGSTHAHVVDISDGSDRTPIGYEDNILYSNNLHQVKISAVDDVFIVYKYTEYGSSDMSKAHYIRLDNVTNPMSLSAFDHSSSYLNNRIDYSLRYVGKSDEHGSIALLITRGYHVSSNNKSGSDNYLIDFGQYMATGSDNHWSHISDNLPNFQFYGEHVIYRSRQKILIANFMPIKLVGKTDTISAMNFIKNISGKQWLIGYTNLPSWGEGTSSSKGVPPGVPIASTNGTGTITGWS